MRSAAQTWKPESKVDKNMMLTIDTGSMSMSCEHITTVILQGTIVGVCEVSKR